MKGSEYCLNALYSVMTILVVIQSFVVYLNLLVVSRPPLVACLVGLKHTG